MSDRKSIESRLSQKYEYSIPIIRKQYKWAEQMLWLVKNVGPRNELWTVKLHKFWFVRQEDALMFALSWSTK